MTDKAKALVAKLRKFFWRGKVRTATAHEAAELIETQAREIGRLKWEMRLAENLLSDCQKHLYSEGIAPPENVIAGIRERLK